VFPRAGRGSFALGFFMKFSALLKDTRMGKIAVLPLSLLPRDAVVPILHGKLRGRRWIVGSAIHRCWIGFYEYKKQRWISREVRPNSVFLDIGANVGFYSLLASKLVGSGKVFAFEPAPRNVSYLRKHLALNRVTNVEVLAIAVSDRNGISSFETEETGFMCHLSSEGKITVPTATLDSLVEEGKVLPPDYVKMDIEGAELLALRGGSRTFQRFRPVLFLATHGREVETECRRLLELWGYDCRNIESKSNSDLGEIIAKFPASSIKEAGRVLDGFMNTNPNQFERLNLGCGPNAPTGWLNVDGSWNAWLSNHVYLRKALKAFGVISKTSPGAQWSVRPLVHDLTKRLPFKDNTVSVIYGAHVLEHLYLADAQRLLSECKRVLRPGGVIRLVVPDLRCMVTSYLKNKNGGSPSASEKIAAADKLNENLGLRSPAPPSGNSLFKFYSLWKDFHHHKWMYDSDSLIHYMKEAGFVAVSEKAYLQSEIPGVAEVEEAGRVLDGAGICVEGRKQ
jgi:FkbM family methyltransferase